MRLTIVPIDSKISVNNTPYTGFDLSWIPEFNGVKVHAVQWYDDHGQIELEDTSPNIVISELGVFEQAVSQWEQKHNEQNNESTIS
jgi:hypothetical protein